MALFPECTFEALLTGGVFVPGERAEGSLEIVAPQAIPRAEQLVLEFRSRAWAGYGSGKNRKIVSRDMFTAPLRVDLAGELAAGTHRYPFAFDVPHWLPPGFRARDCAIEHTIVARLDVNWAKDPSTTIHCLVVPPPAMGTRVSVATRSPLTDFHDTVALEVTLESSVLELDEPLVGKVALRSGHSARFDGVDLAFGGLGRITMAKGDVRPTGFVSKVRIPAEALRDGKAVPFSIPPHRALVPSFRSSFIDHEATLRVSVAVPWLRDPTFDVPLQILPRGSTIGGAASAGDVGNERLRDIAVVMAKGTGLRTGRLPTLIEGEVGPVRLGLVDAPRGAELGLQVDLTYPDLALGIDFRKVTVLDAFRSSPLLAEALAKKHLLRCTNDAPELRSFFDVVLDDVEIAEDVRFSDHHLGFRLRIPDDDPERMLEIAQITQRRAKALAAAIGQLSFPAPAQGARLAWQATAEEQSAFLVPTGPALHGLSFRVRVLVGEERLISAVIRTEWTPTGARHHVDLDLGDAPLPAAACLTLDADPQARGPYWHAAHALGDGHGATLEWEGFAPDPRVLLPGIDHFIGWVLEQRCERRVDLPYR